MIPDRSDVLIRIHSSVHSVQYVAIVNFSGIASNAISASRCVAVSLLSLR